MLTAKFPMCVCFSSENCILLCLRYDNFGVYAYKVKRVVYTPRRARKPQILRSECPNMTMSLLRHNNVITGSSAREF